jgi:hypothetical protein
MISSYQKIAFKMVAYYGEFMAQRKNKLVAGAGFEPATSGL